MRSLERIPWTVLVAIGTILSLSEAGCVHVPLSARAFRRAEYFATHAELPSSPAAAIEVGLVVIAVRSSRQAGARISAQSGT